MGSGGRGHLYEGQHLHQCKRAHQQTGSTIRCSTHNDLSCKGAKGQTPASGHVCVWVWTCHTPYFLSRSKKGDKQVQGVVRTQQPLAAQTLQQNRVQHTLARASNHTAAAALHYRPQVHTSHTEPLHKLPRHSFSSSSSLTSLPSKHAAATAHLVHSKPALLHYHQTAVPLIIA